MENDDVFNHAQLAEEDRAFLKPLLVNLPILADLSRADIFICCRQASHGVIVAQARPHSVAPLYSESYIGRRIGADHPEVLRGLYGKANPRAIHTVNIRGATVARQVYPIYNGGNGIIGVQVMDQYWLAYERHRRRSLVFQEALEAFRAMVLAGALKGSESLTPFGEYDGVMYVGADRHIQYMSGVAASLYRFLGYRDDLVEERVSALETIDHQMVTQVLSEERCLERQDEQYGRTWIRRAIPLLVPDMTLRARLARRMHPEVQVPLRAKGVFILIHDATEALQAQRELASKMAMIREVHHRVKNNLQAIASLMRMQARRAQSEETKHALQESLNRVLSVAVVHEFLSQNAKGTINLKEVSHRILNQVRQGLVDPSKAIQLDVKGPDIWLPSERATQCALVVNELVQNAIEHGMAHQDKGNIEVELIDRGDRVVVIVSDDGSGLPEGFNLSTDSHLGLRIVRSMVERDLGGEFALDRDQLTRAVVRFDKSMLGGG